MVYGAPMTAPVSSPGAATLFERTESMHLRQPLFGVQIELHMLRSFCTTVYFNEDINDELDHLIQHSHTFRL